MKKSKNSYKKSGVNISLANKLVKHISDISKKDDKKTKGSSKIDTIGALGLYLISVSLKLKIQ